MSTFYSQFTPSKKEEAVPKKKRGIMDAIVSGIHHVHFQLYFLTSSLQ